MEQLPFYRQSLHGQLGDRVAKNPKYSLRAFARYLDIEASALSQVLNGKRYLSVEKIDHILSKLDLNPIEQENFRSSLAKAKKNAGHQRFTPEMKAILRETQNRDAFDQKTREVSVDQFKVIADWYHYAILELTLTRDFQSNTEWIARKLEISNSEATLAVERLFSLQLLEDQNGRWKKTAVQLSSADKHLTTGAHRRRQRQVLEKSLKSLENDPIEVRNHSAMTLSIDEKKVPEAKRRIQKFMNELTEFLETGTQTKTYEMIVNLFPLER
jgi:uncharacterized protein (TIGR02147 family)